MCVSVFKQSVVPTYIYIIKISTYCIISCNNYNTLCKSPCLTFKQFNCNWARPFLFLAHKAHIFHVLLCPQTLDITCELSPIHLPKAPFTKLLLHKDVIRVHFPIVLCGCTTKDGTRQLYLPQWWLRERKRRERRGGEGASGRSDGKGKKHLGRGEKQRRVVCICM